MLVDISCMWDGVFAEDLLEPLVGLCNRLVSLCVKGVDLDLDFLAKRNASSASRLLSLVGIVEIG